MPIVGILLTIHLDGRTGETVDEKSAPTFGAVGGF
jgi:hypothetical protein